jgi:hypothetical protein
MDSLRWLLPINPFYGNGVKTIRLHSETYYAFSSFHPEKHNNLSFLVNFFQVEPKVELLKFSYQNLGRFWIMVITDGQTNWGENITS